MRHRPFGHENKRMFLSVSRMVGTSLQERTIFINTCTNRASKSRFHIQNLKGKLEKGLYRAQFESSTRVERIGQEDHILLAIPSPGPRNPGLYFWPRHSEFMEIAVAVRNGVGTELLPVFVM